jgi:shikimate kinase
MSQMVYAMCGLAFSGNSTVAAIMARELGIELISLDAINSERGLQTSSDAGWTLRPGHEYSTLGVN